MFDNIDRCTEVSISRDNKNLIFDNKHTLSATEIYLKYEPTPELHVLYIGKAFGRKERRYARERLLNHESLQKILSDVNCNKLNMDIKLLLIKMKEFKVLTTLNQFSSNNMDNDFIDFNKLNEFPNEEEFINLIEASLINKFKPKYNKEFTKGFVPDYKHTSYKSYLQNNYDYFIINLYNISTIYNFHNIKIKSDAFEMSPGLDGLECKITGDVFLSDLIKLNFYP